MVSVYGFFVFIPSVLLLIIGRNDGDEKNVSANY